MKSLAVRVLKIAIFALGSSTALAANYTCVLEARKTVNSPAASVTGQLNSDRPLELTLQNFTFKLIPTIANGQDQLGIWIGTDNEHSSATSAIPGQQTLYINMVQDQAFAAASCNLD